MLVDQGFVHATEAGDAVDALATAGLLERALVEAAVAEAEDALGTASRAFGVSAIAGFGSSNTPSDSSSTTSTMWRAASAR